MTLPDAIRTCLTKYATFQGRASRSEYWFFVLFMFFLRIAFVPVDLVLFGDSLFSAFDLGPVSAAAMLALLLPYLAVGWRRLHDTGRKGIHMLLFSFLMWIGFPIVVVMAADILGSFTPLTLLLLLLLYCLLVLIWLILPSQPGPNRYGPNPHEVHP